MNSSRARHSSRRKSAPSRFHGWLVAVGLVGFLACASGIVWSSVRPDAGASGPRVSTVAVTRGTIERSVITTGVLQPLELVDVGAQISGQLRSLKVKLGARVQRGQLLAEIDPVLNQAKLIEAEATLENLRAQRHAKAEQLVLAELQSRRAAVLVKQDALSRAEVEVIESNVRVARTGVTSLDAQIRQAEAIVTTARTNLGYTRIVAPMDGEVVSIIAREGQTLNANQQAPIIMRIARLDTMTVWAQVPEAEITRLRVGHPVAFTVLGDPDNRRAGRIRQVLPAPEIVNGVVFYNALFDVANANGALKVQMTAQVYFTVDRAEDALTVPLAALGPDPKARPNRHRVTVVGAGGTEDVRIVETGIKDGAMAQVTRGLAEGDLVVAEDDEQPRRARKSGTNVAKARAK